METLESALMHLRYSLSVVMMASLGEKSGPRVSFHEVVNRSRGQFLQYYYDDELKKPPSTFCQKDSSDTISGT